MRTTYSEEFKNDALRLAEQIGTTKASIQLNVPVKRLYYWQRKKRITSKTLPKGLKPGETLEEGFRRLEKELAEQHEVTDILRRAMGFLAGR